MVERHSDQLHALGFGGLVRGALATPWNPWTVGQVRKAIAEWRPDILHAHNVFPLLSPSVFPAGLGTARVLTLHNYRLYCAAGTAVRQGRICTECLEKQSAWPGVRHACYRSSHLATIPVATGIALHRRRGTWRRDVEAFIALTEFQRAQFVAAGLPAERVHVRPNFHPGYPSVVPWHARGPYAVFAGRLSPEKGVETLVKAWSAWGAAAPELVVLGDGPLRASLERSVATAHSDRVTFLGLVSTSEAKNWISRARLLLLPSECLESFPLALCEACAFGTPSLVSDAGPLPGIVAMGAGRTFRAGDSRDLLTTAITLWGGADTLRQMGMAARAAYERELTEEAGYRRLVEIYRCAMRSAGSAGGGE